MAIGAEKIREGRRKYLASLSPEEREEIEKTKREAEVKSKKRWEEIGKLINEKLEANAHHEKAIGILKEAVQLAASDPAMTPEVKELADMIVFLIEDRNLHDYTFDSIMEPVVKEIKSESGKNGAKHRHAKNYELHDDIREIWASGKYSSRDICAEQEFSALGFGSFKTARKALINTPDPRLPKVP